MVSAVTGVGNATTPNNLFRPTCTICFVVVNCAMSVARSSAPSHKVNVQTDLFNAYNRGWSCVDVVALGCSHTVIIFFRSTNNNNLCL
jgi:hypothetical protein